MAVRTTYRQRRDRRPGGTWGWTLGAIAAMLLLAFLVFGLGPNATRTARNGLLSDASAPQPAATQTRGKGAVENTGSR
jgi:hypothetical protein